jgi:hypothetical protein
LVLAGRLPHPQLSPVLLVAIIQLQVLLPLAGVTAQTTTRLVEMAVLVEVEQKTVWLVVSQRKHLELVIRAMEMLVALEACIPLEVAEVEVVLVVLVKRQVLDALVALVEQILFLELLLPMRLVVVVRHQTPLQTHLLVLPTQETERLALARLVE